MSSQPIVKIVIGGVSYSVTDLTLPNNRSFDGAFATADGAIVTIDMAAAREIQKDRVRLDRAAAWDACDEMLIDAQEPSLTQQQKDDKLAAWSTLRQKYKDAPAYIDATTAPDADTLETLTFDYIVSVL